MITKSLNNTGEFAEPPAYEWNIQHRQGRYVRREEEAVMLTGDDEHTARAVPEVERLVAERELREPGSEERVEIEAQIRAQIGRWARAMEAL